MSFGVIFPPNLTEELVFWADQTRPQTDNTLSVIDEFNNIFVSKVKYVGSTQIQLQKSGAYRFEIETWQCGTGNGEARVVVTRNGNVIYDRRKIGSYSVCGVGTSVLYWNQFKAGDLVEFYANANNTGTIVGTADNQDSASSVSMGGVRVYYVYP